MRHGRSWARRALLVTGVAVGLVLVAQLALHATDREPTLQEQAQALKAQIFTSPRPTDPVVVNEQYAEYEKQFAALGTPAVPSGERPTDLPPDGPDRFSTGIFDSSDNYIPGYHFINSWQGVVDNARWRVFAGSDTSDSPQGGVVLVSLDEGPGPFQAVPDQGGPVRITDVVGSILTLQDESGTSYYYDVEKADYVAGP